MNQEDSVKASNLEEIFQPIVSPANLLEQLLSITESFIDATCKSQPERDLDIIKKRFGLNRESVYSLEEIGVYYDITRERVRQVEFKIISKLSELMYGSSSRGCKFSYPLARLFSEAFSLQNSRRISALLY